MNPLLLYCTCVITVTDSRQFFSEIRDIFESVEARRASVVIQKTYRAYSVRKKYARPTELQSSYPWEADTHGESEPEVERRGIHIDAQFAPTFEHGAH